MLRCNKNGGLTVPLILCRVDVELAAQRIPSDLANDTNLNSLERLFIERKSTINSYRSVVVIHSKKRCNEYLFVPTTRTLV